MPLDGCTCVSEYNVQKTKRKQSEFFLAHVITCFPLHILQGKGEGVYRST